MKDDTKSNLTDVKLHPESRRPVHFSAVALTLLLAMLAQITAAAAPCNLEGQSKGSSTWVSGKLVDWQDLDYIPCRVRIIGGAITNQIIKLTFPRLNGDKPGFENLLGFTASPNVNIASAPVLSSPANAD